MKKVYGVLLGRFLLLMPTVLIVALLFEEQPKKDVSSSETLVVSQDSVKPVVPSVPIDLRQIKERGKLIALTGYSYTSYFIYKGSPMGYEYELLERFCKSLGVKLEIVVVKDMDRVFEKLNQGAGDIIAENIPVAQEWEELADFTVPCNITRQVLVQRKPENGHSSLKELREDVSLVRDPLDLAGKTIHIRKNSAYYQRVKDLAFEIGEDIHIVEMSGETGTEELIQKVAEGEIEYTVADEQTAMANQTWYVGLDIATPVSFPQKICWAVRKNSPELLDACNAWIRKMKKDPEWYAIRNKYFRNRKTLSKMVNCSRYATCVKKISPYDRLIRKEAIKIGWDWKLVTSIIFQESRFNPTAKSWAGASGLMQLMPATAAGLGVKNPEDPVENIRGGLKYLSWLENYWKKIPDPEERLKFILASYNVGQEHVADARRLARKYGKDPDVWEDNVAICLLMKSKEKYRQDPVVRFGYCRGQEPVNYVEAILNRYNHYKKLIKDDIYLASVK